MTAANDSLREHLRAVAALADELEGLPAELTAHEYLYETFGSWYVIVRRNGRRYRFDFDGRDRLLLGSEISARAGEPYRAPKRYLVEQSLPDGLTIASLPIVVEAIRRAAV